MSQLEDFSRLGIGAAAQDALLLIEEELKQGQYDADRVAYAHIAKGTLTPEMAQLLFARKHALYSLQESLRQKARMGVSAAKRLNEADNG